MCLYCIGHVNPPLVLCLKLTSWEGGMEGGGVRRDDRGRADTEGKGQGTQKKGIKSEQSQNWEGEKQKSERRMRRCKVYFLLYLNALPPFVLPLISLYLQLALSPFVLFTFLPSCAGCSHQLAALGRGQGMKTPSLPVPLQSIHLCSDN